MKKLDMRKNETPGFLITFCGLDGCGKTTMMKRLIADLEKSSEIFVTKQPTNAVRNSEIFRTYMDSPNHDAFDYRSLSLLAASDRLQHVNKIIEPEMNEGRIVLSDRYFYSCFANLRARGFEKDRWIYEIARSVIKPDVAFFFDVPVEEAVTRVRRRPEEKERYIDIELQHRLRKEYIDICASNKGILVSTLQSEDECYEIVKNAVFSAIATKSRTILQKTITERRNLQMEGNKKDNIDLNISNTEIKTDVPHISDKTQDSQEYAGYPEEYMNDTFYFDHLCTSCKYWDGGMCCTEYGICNYEPI